MLNSAREHLAQFGARVSLVACDLLHVPFKAAFEGIVSTAAFHWVLDHDRLFANLRGVLIPGGWLEAQCGGGPNLVRLRSRADALAATSKFAPYFTGFREPWLYQDAEAAAATLRRAGFVDVETSVEAAPTQLDDADHYREFVRNIILRRHLENLPNEEARSKFINLMTEQARKDDPPFLLDYWRLNLPRPLKLNHTREISVVHPVYLQDRRFAASATCSARKGSHDRPQERGCFVRNFWIVRGGSMRRSILGLVLFLLASLMAFGQSATPNDGTPRQDVRKDVRETHQDKRDLRSDVRDTKQDRAAMEQAVNSGDKAAAEKDRHDLRKDRRDSRKDLKDAKKDKRETRRDVRQEKMMQQRRMARSGRR